MNSDADEIADVIENYFHLYANKFCSHMEDLNFVCFFPIIFWLYQSSAILIFDIFYRNIQQSNEISWLHIY